MEKEILEALNSLIYAVQVGKFINIFFGFGVMISILSKRNEISISLGE
jgi:hypothetical protein